MEFCAFGIERHAIMIQLLSTFVKFIFLLLLSFPFPLNHLIQSCQIILQKNVKHSRDSYKLLAVLSYCYCAEGLRFSCNHPYLMLVNAVNILGFSPLLKKRKKLPLGKFTRVIPEFLCLLLIKFLLIYHLLIIN